MVILRTTTKNLCFLFIPITIFIIGLVFTKPMFPIYLNSGIGYGPDAAYVYLFAALDMLQGYSPVFTDHPGTPLQTIIAAVILGVWSVTRVLQITTVGVVESVLQNPELYLLNTTTLLLLLTGAASYYLGIKLYRATSNIGIALSCQLTPLLFPLVSPMMAYPTAESFLQVISISLIATLIPSFYKNENSVNSEFKIEAFTAGALCGIGLATKLTFLPMLGLLLIFNSWRLLVLSLLGLTIAFTLGIAPIISRIPTMFDWYLKMASHSELHGLGSSELFNFVKLKGGLIYLWDMLPLFYYIFTTVTVVLIAVLIWMKLSSTLKINFLLGSFILVSTALFQTVIVAKHPGLPYMLPVLSLATFSVGYLLNTVFTMSASSSLKKEILIQGLSCLWLLVIVYIATMSTASAYASLSSNRIRAQASHDSIATEISKYENPILVGSFNCSFKGCATWFGIALTHGLDLKMDLVQPLFFYYDIFSKNLRTPGQAETPRDQTPKTINNLINAGHTLLLISPDYEQNSHFKLIELVKTPNQKLYRIVGYE